MKRQKRIQATTVKSMTRRSLMNPDDILDILEVVRRDGALAVPTAQVPAPPENWIRDLTDAAQARNMRITVLRPEEANEFWIIDTDATAANDVLDSPTTELPATQFRDHPEVQPVTAPFILEQ
jgi:hypothetical protein